jgi:hypothetical protein
MKPLKQALEGLSEMLEGWRALAFASLLAFLSIGALVGPPAYEQSGQLSYYASAGSAPVTPDERLADYTEALARFTKWLVLVTGALFVASVWQGWLTRRSVNLARDEFLASHQPEIVIHTVEFTNNVTITPGAAPSAVNSLGATITYFSKGRTAANIVEIAAVIGRYTPTPPVGIDLRLQAEPGRVPNGRYTLRLMSDFDPIEESTWQQGLLPNGKLRTPGDIFCIGRIVYLDARENRREVGFCRKLDATAPCWDRVAGSGYEYSY